MGDGDAARSLFRLREGADEVAARTDAAAAFWASVHTVSELSVMSPASVPLYEGTTAAPQADVRADADWRPLLERGSEAQRRFRDGYATAGGRPDYLQHLIDDVIPCEYGWGEYVKANYYESRAQFDPQSWQTAGGGDPADDFTVGRNVANWIALIDDPGSTSGWPFCWNVGTIP